MARTVPPRLHVILARNAPTAVVIRRGPTRHTAVVGWDRRTDQFTVGQWLYGRIYERRCDLSPDGRHFIYFAMNGRWHTESKGSWTAISRAPYLKALALFPKGDCWNGGGLFLSNRAYWLNDGCGHATLRDESGLTCSPVYPWHEGYGGECPGVYFIRLQRDGWTMQHTTTDAAAGGTTTQFEKPLAGHWRLRKLARATLARSEGRGVYYDEHELWNARTEEKIACPGWEWADVDGERLVWAEGGKIFTGQLMAAGLLERRELYDFSTMQFEKLVAPY